jgi:hypothetical protein
MGLNFNFSEVKGYAVFDSEEDDDEGDLDLTGEGDKEEYPVFGGELMMNGDEDEDEQDMRLGSRGDALDEGEYGEDYGEMEGEDEEEEDDDDDDGVED